MTMQAIVKQIQIILTGCTLTQEQAKELHDTITYYTDKTETLDGKTIEGSYPGTAEDAYSAKAAYPGNYL